LTAKPYEPMDGETFFQTVIMVFLYNVAFYLFNFNDMVFENSATHLLFSNNNFINVTKSINYSSIKSDI